ncbi:hypothetical protein JCM10207_006404 [Rhodosporidiobolus poonsookiae]
MRAPNPRKRALLPLVESASSARDKNGALVPFKRSRISGEGGGCSEEIKGADEVGRLTIRNALGTHVLVIERDKPFHIGRAQACDFRLDGASVSARHCTVYSILTDTDETLVILQDTSTNGTLHNDRVVGRGKTVVLSEGDRIEITKHLFRYSHTAPSFASLPRPSAAPTPQALVPGQPRKIGTYLISPRTLGSGAFSQVFLALNTRSLKQVACKTLQRVRVKGDRLKAIQREVDVLRRVEHPNINKIEDVVIDKDAVHIFLQLVSGGDLFSYLVKKVRLDAPEAKFVLYQLLLGLQYLHETAQIAHRDIKLENVILSTSGPFPKVQLADFGQSRALAPSASASKDDKARFHSLNGTLQYMAPEQLMAWTRKGGYDGKKADCWSLGIVLALLLTGTHPFEPWSSSLSSSTSSNSPQPLSATLFGASAVKELEGNPQDKRVCRAVVEGEVALGTGRFGSEDYHARALLAHLLSHEPSTRASASQALKSRWIGKSRVELEKLYEKVVGKEGK